MDNVSLSIEGQCSDRFSAVRAAFERNFAELGEVGAAVSVVIDGECVVDLWGGVADAATARAWDRDTLTLVFSTTKGLTAICALLLWERGDLDLDAPVAEVWPEFAAGGKAKITTRDLLSHRAGLPAFDEPIAVRECHDLDLVAGRLAAQTPRWQPGTAHGYHALTYGWLVGEVVRRTTGRTVGQLFATEVAGPLHLDAYIGLPEHLASRVSTLLPMNFDRLLARGLDDKIMAIGAKILDPESLTFRVFTNPPVADTEEFNRSELHRAEWPAANGIATARSLSALYGELARDRVLSPATLDAASSPQSQGPDEVLVINTAFGLGFQLPSELCAFGPNGRGFGHDGAGGSVAFADREKGLGFAYVMNQMSASLGYDERADGLVRAAYASIGEGA